MTVGPTLRWHDEDRLTPEQSAALSGPGAPFERTTENVLGADVEVFVQRPRSLVEVLRNSAEQFGDRPYLVFPDLGSGGETVTFAEVPERAGAIAAVLADEYGIGKGDRVAFASANSLEYALAQLAVVSLGAIIVGLNGWWTGPELAYGMELTTPKVLFGDEARLARLADVGITGTEMPEDHEPRRAARRRHRRGRPVHDPLHLGDDRSPEGRDADASQHGAHGVGDGVRACRHHAA